VPVSLSLIGIVNLSHRFSLNYVKEWAYDQNNIEVTNFLHDQFDHEPISLKTSWFFNPSLRFYAETGQIPWIELYPYDSKLDVNTNAEYYYIFAKEYDILKPKFEIIYKFSDDRWLLKRINP
jgi:hypothetical protein